MQKLVNNAYDAISALVFLATISLWYSNEFYINLKVILCRIEWSLFQVSCKMLYISTFNNGRN